MVLPEVKQENNVREIAMEIGMSFDKFKARCIEKGLSIDTAKALWFKAERDRGYFKTTRNLVADILKKPVEEIFGKDQE
jgi:hypothetical protein